MKRLARNAGFLLLAVFVLWGAFTVAMRRKYPPVVNAVRRLNRAVINPGAMRRAAFGAFASVIRHVVVRPEPDTRPRLWLSRRRRLCGPVDVRGGRRLVEERVSSGSVVIVSD